MQDWRPEYHLAHFIADVTNELDLSAIYAQYERQDSRGLSAYHPLLLTRLLLYGYCVGVTSSRRIERRKRVEKTDQPGENGENGENGSRKRISLN